MAARSSLYNEDRNLLRIRERERRNQEAHQEQELFLEKAPLFGEPYKTNKGDELSSRIQSMLGNYEEVTELIDNHAHQDFIGIPKSTASTPAKEKPGRPLHTDKTQPPLHHAPRPRVPPPNPSPGSSCSSQHSRQPPLPEHSQKPPGSGSSSLRLGQAPDCHQRAGDAWSDLDDGVDLPALLPALSPPAEPLSPLHSSEPSDGEPPDAEDEGRPEPRGQGEGGPVETARKDIPSAAANDAAAATATGPLPSQTFPPPLPSKTSLAMLQKPTAYVRPMDGQDQAPSESPDLKPSPDDFHGQSYGNFSDLKMAAKAKLSSLKIPSQPAETLSNEAHCVEEILREMTHSWPPPLTAIHTPSTSEPSKFPFPGKESQHVNSGFVGQKQCGPSQRAPPPTCQQGSAPPETSGVVPTHSSGGESASSSESESTSGSESESESSSSDGEEAPQPPRSSPPAPENEKSSVNKWQLDYWLVKVNQQNSHADSQGDLVPSVSPETKRHGEEEGSPAEGFKPKDSCPPSELSDGEAKGAQEASDHPPPSRKSPACTGAGSQKQPAGGKQPRKPAKVLLPEGSRKEESGRPSPRRRDPPFTEKPKVKTKNRRDGSGAQPEEAHKSARRASSGGKNCREPASKRTHCEAEGEGSGARAPSPKCESRHPSLSVRTSACQAAPEPKGGAKRGKAPPLPPAEAGGKEVAPRAVAEPPRTLVVKIELRLLSRIPQPAGQPGKAARKNRGVDRKRQEPGKEEMVATPKVPKKRPAEPDGKSLERKKPKLDKELKPSSSHHSSHTAKLPKCSGGKEKQKVKAPVSLAREPSRGAGHKRQSSESGTASNAKDSGPASTKHKKTTGKRAEHPKSGKKATQSSCPPFPVPSLPTGTSKPSRPLLKFDDKQYPVEHYMKEAKILKHKADSMADKTEKAFNYLDAAVSFIESGIAMETDPQTPKSPYTMFSETLDLIRFILKLKNFVDPSAVAREKDFAVLCMRCQSLLQMAMFRYKREAALKYSRTLTEHFRSSSRSAQAPSPCVGKATGTASPMSPMPSPASSSSSGPGSNHSTGTGAVTTVAIPQVIQQVASSYVSITALFLSAHEIWEQAEALAHRSPGLLEELNSAMGPLSLTSSIRDLVRHTRQGLQWLRLS